jgi:hypothetical protein
MPGADGYRLKSAAMSRGGESWRIHPREVHSNRATAAEGCDYRTLNASPELLRRAAGALAGSGRGLPFFPSAIVLEAHYADEVPLVRLARVAGLSPYQLNRVFRRALGLPSPTRWRFRAETALAQGRNEIVMAVAEYFGGWGLIARFDDPAGLSLP